MSTPATYDDVNLILRLYELRREEKMRAARAWFSANCHATSLADLERIAPVGSQENAYMRMVTSYWEMVASFVTSGVLNSELLFQSSHEMLVVWLRMKPVVAEFRAVMKNTAAYRNLEAVGNEYAAFIGRQSPEALEMFAARVGTPPKAQAAKQE